MSKRLATAAVVAAALVATPALAQGNEVLATVDGTEITRDDVEFAYDTVFRDLFGDLPEDQARQRVLELLVDLNLMADAAREAGLGATPEFARRMALIRLQTLQDRYMADIVEREVTEEAIQERYDALSADFPYDEVNAAHILVRTEEEARDILAELEAGEEFADLAAEYSMDPGTRERGGSLGWFPRGQMVPAFEEAAFTLEPGETTSEPVQSQFGWHVIRVDDRRTREAPPLEEVRDRVREILIRQVFADAVNTLRQEADIDLATPADGSQ
jgi:peptidyl-prolyl cis-trans isomerase C